MKLSQLTNRLSALGAKTFGSGDPEVTGVALHSMHVRRGYLFVAIPGTKANGNDFVVDALRRGAVAVLTEKELDNCQVPGICVSSPRAAAADAAAALYREPALSMRTIGTTGTNGKTTVATLLRWILEKDRRACAFLGTLGYSLAGKELPAPNTTPDAVTLQGFFRELLDAGVRYCSMEVSSIALDQDRVRGIPFAAAVFTNLTHDHLDYHKTFERYADAKKKLFDGLDEGAVAVGNAEDPSTERLFSGTRARKVLYGIDGAAYPAGSPQVMARILRSDLDGVDFLLRATDLGGQGACEVKVSSPLLGVHNVQNALAAAATALALGVRVESIVSGIETLGLVQGRLERVDGGRPFRVFVDYAHTPDGLERVLSTLRPLTRRKLSVVFGCGGDRDRGKRPKMGAIAARLADTVYLTSDNPRGEDPVAIAQDVLAGVDAAHTRCVVVELDRRRAIRAAIESARTGDVILIAGKGHENYQIIGDATLPFDDRQVAREALGA